MKEKEEQLLNELAEFVNPVNEDFDKNDFDSFVSSLSETDNIIPYLKYVQGVEMRNYFNAQSDAQKSHIRGRYSFATTLLALVVKQKQLLQKKS
jgi:hypothetical protein